MPTVFETPNTPVGMKVLGARRTDDAPPTDDDGAVAPAASQGGTSDAASPAKPKSVP
jgi:hypothetical protein